MHTNADFPPANPNETQPYSIDFINDLPVGQTIIGANVTLTTYQGTDSNPSSHLIGSTPSQIISTIVTQIIGNLVAGNIYSLNIVAISSNGFTYELYAFIPCQDVL